MASAGLSPQVLSDVTKQTLEAVKMPSEIAKNVGAANYYNSEADYNRFKSSDTFLNHQLAVARAPQEAYNAGMKEFEDYKDAILERRFDRLRGIKVPALLNRITGMNTMDDVYRSFGSDAGNILMAAIQSQMHMAGYAAQRGQNELVKKISLFEKINNDIAKMKELPTQEQWDKADARQRRIWADNKIIGPRSQAAEDAIRRLEFGANRLGLEIYGPTYQSIIDATRATDSPIIDRSSLPPGTPKNKAQSSFGKPPTTVWFTPIGALPNLLGSVPPAASSAPNITYNPFDVGGGL